MDERLSVIEQRLGNIEAMMLVLCLHLGCAQALDCDEEDADGVDMSALLHRPIGNA